jgi:hypothetical protein
MSLPIQVRISRDGKEIGTYSSDEVVKLRINGTLQETDFYWHDGMTEWAPLTQFLASEARRVLAERQLLQKQEEAKKAERLALERAKAKEEEDKAVAEATRSRLAKEKEGRYKCHCCRNSFAQPRDHGTSFGFGVMLIVGSGIVLWITYKSAIDTYRPSPGGIAFGSWLASVAFFVGLSLFTVANLRPPCCPLCDSTNFSKPDRTDEQK